MRLTFGPDEIHLSENPQAEKNRLVAQGVDFTVADGFSEPQGPNLMVYYIVSLVYRRVD